MLAAGQPLDADMLMFASFGERFRDHLTTVTKQDFDANRPADMLDLANEQLAIAKRANDAHSVTTWLILLNFWTSCALEP